MWLFCKRGFYSAVQEFGHPDSIIVRARFRNDLERMQKYLEERQLGKPGIEETPDSDYGYRLRVSRSVWANFVQDTAKEIDYGNFKQAALTDGNRRRSIGYHEVWSAMRNVAIN